MAKKYARDNDLQGWNDVVVWRDFKLPYIPRDIWLQYIEHVTSERFTRTMNLPTTGIGKFMVR